MIMLRRDFLKILSGAVASALPLLREPRRFCRRTSRAAHFDLLTADASNRMQLP